MYIILATSIKQVPNPYYYPGAGRIEPEYHEQSCTATFEAKTSEELILFMTNRAGLYETVKYYEAKEVFPELVQTVKVSFK